MKRFQNCNKLEKIFRYRWYLMIPLLWTWYSTFLNLNLTSDENETESLKGSLLWSILLSKMQFKMNWYYTNDEVFNEINKKYGKQEK